MGWVYLDDQFPDHPKFALAGDLAGWLFVCGLAYCRRQETEGRIPKAIVPKLVHARTGPLAARLIDVGLWHDDGAHYVVHDYHDWNKPTENRRAAGRKAARARWDREKNASAHANASESHSGRNGNAYADRCPPPLPPPLDTSLPPPTEAPAVNAQEGKLIAAAAGLLARRDLEQRGHQDLANVDAWLGTVASKHLDRNRTDWLERLANHPDLSSTQLADGTGRPRHDLPEIAAARHQADLDRTATIIAAADEPIDRSTLAAIKANRPPRVTRDPLEARPFGQEAS